MYTRNNFKFSDSTLVYLFFFFANVPAWIIRLWRFSQYIYIETGIWALLVTLAVWKIKADAGLIKIPALLKKSWVLFPFIFFSGMSVFWSILAGISFSRWVTLLCLVVAGVYIRLKYDLEKYIELISFFAFYTLIFATLIVVFVSDIGVMYYHIIQGAWRGMFWHKNHLGLFASFANILFLINIIQYAFFKKSRNKLVLWGIAYALSVLLIAQSDSTAAYLTTIFLHGLVALIVFYLKMRERLKRWHYQIFLIFALAISVFLLFNLGFVFGKFNRNTTLTGRVPMWNFLFENYVSERPMGGYGLNAFWQLDLHKVETQIAAGYPDPIVIADNGFIDILLNTGYLGLAFFLIFYVGLWWCSIVFMKNKDDIIGFFPVIFLSYTLIANISWSLIYESESFFMLLMVSMLFFTVDKEK